MEATTVEATTAIAVSSGGTGISSYAIDDILYANNSTTLSKLSKGANSTVLQVNASGDLQYNTVATNMIADSAVTTAKIADDAVTYTKMQNIGTVSYTHLTLPTNREV